MYPVSRRWGLKVAIFCWGLGKQVAMHGLGRISWYLLQGSSSPTIVGRQDYGLVELGNRVGLQCFRNRMKNRRPHMCLTHVSRV